MEFRALQHIKAFLARRAESRDIHRRLCLFSLRGLIMPLISIMVSVHQTEEVANFTRPAYSHVVLSNCVTGLFLQVAVKWCEISNFVGAITFGVFTGVTCHPSRMRACRSAP